MLVARRHPQRIVQALTSGLAAVIVFAIVGLIGFVMASDARRDRAARAAGRTAAVDRLASRATDPAPLTVGEVFPGVRIHPAPGARAYPVGATDRSTDCRSAAVGRLGVVLADYGCSQVVRAAVIAPYGRYRVTAGVFNLPSETATVRAGAQTRRLVESGQGTFAPLTSLTGRRPGERPLAQVGWRERGHYLVYCVISRPDGTVVRDDDPDAERITVDLVESYLSGQVLGRRA